MLITYNASKLTIRTTSRSNSRVRICIRSTLRDIAAEEEGAVVTTRGPTIVTRGSIEETRSGGSGVRRKSRAGLLVVVPLWTP